VYVDQGKGPGLITNRLNDGERETAGKEYILLWRERERNCLSYLMGEMRWVT
jgi:hypothetical protein